MAALQTGTTRLTRHFKAPRAQVYAALTSAGSIAKWKTPEGTTLKMTAFNGHTGGGFRISLRTARGQMTITISLRDADGGTELVAVHEGVSSGDPDAEDEGAWNTLVAALVEPAERRLLGTGVAEAQGLFVVTQEGATMINRPATPGTEVKATKHTKPAKDADARTTVKAKGKAGASPPSSASNAAAWHGEEVRESVDGSSAEAAAARAEGNEPIRAEAAARDRDHGTYTEKGPSRRPRADDPDADENAEEKRQSAAEEHAAQPSRHFPHGKL